MTEALPTPYLKRWLLLAVVMMGTFLSILDSIVINVAFPYIMTAFGANVEQVKWVTVGFMIAAMVSMPLTPWLGRRLGHGNLYIIALGVFAIGSAGSATAWTLDMLIFFRIVQGIAAGTIQPSSMVLLTRSFPAQSRGRAFGIWSVGVMVAPSLGPTTGGLLIEWFSWRAIFSISLIIGICALVFAMAVLSREREDAPQPFDFTGYGALTMLLVTGTLTLAFGQQLGWGSGIILCGAAVTGMAFVLFVLLEAEAAHPIVPLRLLRIPDFALSLWLTLYKPLIRLGGAFLLPIFLHQVQGRSSSQIGFLLMPGALLNTLINPLSGWLMDRFGGRWPAFVGGILLSYSLYLYRELDALSGLWSILFPQVFRAVGISLIDMPVVTTGMNAVSREDAGHASWLINLSQRVGGVLTISGLSALLYRETAVYKDVLGQSPLAHKAPLARLIQQGVGMGFNARESSTAARAAYGAQIGRLARTLAFQKLHVMMACATLTSLLPALLLSQKQFSPGQ